MPATQPTQYQDCPECHGDGKTVCCMAYDVGESGPRGCRCSRPGYKPCAACEGSGQVEPEYDGPSDGYDPTPPREVAELTYRQKYGRRHDPR